MTITEPTLSAARAAAFHAINEAKARGRVVAAMRCAVRGDGTVTITLRFVDQIEEKTND